MNKRCFVVIIFLMIFSVLGWSEVYVHDSFDNALGSLNNTRPDGFQKAKAKTAWWKDDSSSFVRKDGALLCAGEQPATCAVMLPAIEKGQKISVCVLADPSSISDTGKIHFGLSSHRKYVKAKGGQVWVSLWLPPGKQSGVVFVYGGDGRTRHLLAKQTGVKFDRPVTLSYSTVDGAVEVLSGDSSIYEGPVTYNGLEGHVVPLENIKCVGFEFDGVAGSDCSEQAEVSEIEIKIEK